MKRRTLAGFLLALFTGTAMAAGTLQRSGMEEGRYQVIKHPLGGGTTITQNFDPDKIEAGAGVACSGAAGTTDTGNWRLYDLDGDHGLSGEICVTNVAYGMESVTSDQTITLRIGCHSGQPQHPYSLHILELPFVTDVGMTTELIPGDGSANLAPFETAVSGCCDADTEDLVVGLISPDCDAAGDPACPSDSGFMYMGGNALGQARPCFISAEDCSIVDPIDIQLLGFVDAYHLQAVTVEQGGEPVPVVTGLGLLSMALILAGTGTWFLRRRSDSRVPN